MTEDLKEPELHILGRLSKTFPQKAARRALLAFCTPPRLAAPQPTHNLKTEELTSAEGLKILRWTPEASIAAHSRRVLLVHGWGLQAISMQSFVPGLVERDFQVWAFDGPAHGDSPGTRATGADFVRAILALTDQYGAFDAIVGHSVGGAAASIAMGKGAPIKRAALLAPAYLPEVVDNFAKMVDLTEPVKEIFWELLKAEARSPLEDWSSPNLAHLIKQPVVIFHDPDDAQVSIVHSRRFVEVASDAVLHEAPQAGHNRILLDQKVVAEIVGFINR